MTATALATPDGPDPGRELIRTMVRALGAQSPSRRKPRVDRLADLARRTAEEAAHLAVIHPATHDLAVLVAELAEETRLIARAIDGAV